MTFTTAIAITSAALAIYVAVLNHRFARAPGWSDQRWFSAVAFAIAAYSILNVPITLASSDAVVLAASRAQLLVVPVHSAAWLMYSRGQSGTPARRWELALAGTLAALGVLGLVPDIVYRLPLTRTTFAPLGITYVVPQATLLGDLLLGLSVATLAFVAGRFFVAWRRRSRYAFIQFVALATFFALAANDTFIAMGLYTGPYLVDLGFVVPVGVVGYSLTSRFAEDARALAELRTGLQKLVDERTRQLTQAQDALHEAEKLAALGQFSTGVAHEVNNPAAVVSANLKYIEESLDQEGGLPPDARDCIQECITAVDRIAGIVRQLLDAGRLAANKIPLQPVSVAACAREAAATAISHGLLDLAFVRYNAAHAGADGLQRAQGLAQLAAVQAVGAGDQQGAAGDAGEDRGVGDGQQRRGVDDDDVVGLGQLAEHPGHRPGADHLAGVRRHLPGGQHVHGAAAPGLDDVVDGRLADEDGGEPDAALQPHVLGDGRAAQVGVDEGDA